MFPSAKWATEKLEDELDSIKEHFSNFGDSIGNNNAAIWFSKDSYSSLPDIERSKFYCDLLGINYNDGPYIITSRKRPDLITQNDEFSLIKLNGISSKRIVKILNVVEQDIRLTRDFSKRKLIFEEIKQRLLSVADRNPDLVKEFGSGLISTIVN